MAGLERQLANEAAALSGYIMPTPDLGDRGQGADDGSEGELDPLDALRADMAAGKGRTLLAPTMAAGLGAGPGMAPWKDYKSERYGFDPADPVLTARRDTERSISACYGCPPVLWDNRAPGVSLREAWRINHNLALAPLALLVGSQLSAALGVQVTLDMKRARSADVVMLSRAISSLVTAGFTKEEARTMVGL